MSLACCGTLRPQLPFEIFAGNERTTLDLMFFKFLNKDDGSASRWLFFNRNRAGVDYRMTANAYLPQFGFTEALSYNHPKLGGIAPVGVFQAFNAGVYPKAGVQYALVKKNFTLFTWVVCETLDNPDLDYFILMRFTPYITARSQLFLQFENLSTIPVGHNGQLSHTQRMRWGLQRGTYQLGVGADFFQYGKNTSVSSRNPGLFIRHQF